MISNKRFRFAIDRGGTFTDVFCLTPNDKIVTLKLLSENKEYYSDAPTYAIKKIIAQVNFIIYFNANILFNN
jgi:5-oxoprolinase (ATP-hydrolysing)